jgi:hypothetical protein
MLKFLLVGADNAGINIGDIIFQLMSFLILLGIPLAITTIILKSRRKRNDHLNRIEEKLDQLLAEKEQNSKGE